MDEIFRVLEIEPTKDKRNIKRAYAAMAKKFHPEENPQEWQRLHDAYEAAMVYADEGTAQIAYMSYIQQTDHANPNGVNFSEDDEEGREVRQLFETWQQEQEQRYREAYRVTQLRLRYLEMDYIQSFEKWREFMISPETRLFWTEIAVLEGIAKALSGKAIDFKTSDFLHEQIKEIRQDILKDSSDDESKVNLVLLEQIQRLIERDRWEMMDDFSKAGRMRFGKTVLASFLFATVLVGLFFIILLVASQT